ncbi:rho gtpase activating protein [Stylonychia lemnae]|uniref:Rho gtpase activating protein n=1 Tax=Stylonychia lemnae TaxID=5949 RepID=A0A078AB82_STYLE|nr:rho gtpase activating protein [Stylonychia lemnae]|eukprot:CDW79414.1 rho gtpase activating protein [Stylonychia lemnae]
MVNQREISMKVNFTDISAAQSYVATMAQASLSFQVNLIAILIDETMQLQIECQKEWKKKKLISPLKHICGFLRKDCQQTLKFQTDSQSSWRYVNLLNLIIISSFQWKLIYVHSNLGGTKKGALLKFKQIYGEMTDQQRSNLQQIYLVQPSLYIKSRLLVEGCMQKTIRDAFGKMQSFNKQKYLPLQILDTYQRELSSLQTPDLELYNYTESVITNTSDASELEDPVFQKKSSSVLNVSNFDKDQIKKGICLSHDTIGKHLKAFYRAPNSDLPQIFVYIDKYFLENPMYLGNSKIFNKLDAQECYELDYLETQIVLGNYSYLLKLSDPKIVITLLRNILKYMEEPLCTYQYFPLFKKICENLSKTMNFEEIIEQVKNLILLQDNIYQETWKFLIKLLKNLTNTKVFTKKQLAQIFSDVIFKAPQFWANDMMSWRQFQDLLALIISKNEVIFPPDNKSVIAEKVSLRSDVGMEEYSLWDPDTQDKFKSIILA